MSRIAIVGSGIGALAIAIRCKLKGHDVEVFEQSCSLGGKLSEMRFEGYRFDMGPSLFTLPSLVDELFTLAGKKPSDYLSYHKLNIITRYFYPDGTIVNAYSDAAAFAKEAEQKVGISAQRVLGYLDKSKDLYDRTANLFIFSPFNLLKLAKSDDAKAIAKKPLMLLAHKKMHAVNVQRLGEPKMVQLFDRYATYNGSNPYKAPGTLTIIPHLEHNIGAFFPDNGMFAIVESLVKLGEELGVKYHTNSRVGEISISNSVAKGISVNGRFREADVVVCNADVSYAYKHLLPKLSLGVVRSRLKPSTSALIFYWGMNQQFDNLDVHNILFSGSYKDEFRMLDKGRIYHDPTVYIFIGSKACAADAPKGKEGWFTMINVPANTGQHWDLMITEARKNIQNKIKQMLGIDVTSHIVAERITDPRSIEARTSSLRGALYGFSSNNPFSAFLRHPNRHSKIRNLYFVGGSVHPGGGIPLCIASAKIADSEMDA